MPMKSRFGRSLKMLNVVAGLWFLGAVAALVVTGSTFTTGLSLWLTGEFLVLGWLVFLAVFVLLVILRRKPAFQLLQWLTVPAVLGLAFGIFSFVEDPERPCKWPTDRELLADFHSHRAQIDQLASMAAADSRLGRISDTWYLDAAGTHYEKPQPRLLSASRWREYKRLFRELRLDDGLSHAPGEIELLRCCEGLVGSGGCKGYVLRQNPPDKLYENLDRLPVTKEPEDFHYRHIEGPWYLFVYSS